MSDIKKIISDIQKFLQKVTPGPWTSSENAYGAVFVHGGKTLTSSVGTEYKELIAGGNSHNTLTLANADFMASCNPANMRVILSALADAERERDELRKDFGILCKAIVGETGLSAIEEAGKLRARAQAAEAKLSTVRQKLSEAEEIIKGRDRAEAKLAEALKVMEPFDNIAKLAGFRGVQNGEIVSVSIDFCRAARDFLASMKGGES